MKKLFILFLIAYIPFRLFAGDKDLLKVRDLYYRASANKEDAEIFHEYLIAKPEITTDLLSGYKGISYMIKANYSWNPYNKLSFFNKGKDLLDNAIGKDPSNVELRFLRYCVQANAPGFLGYSGKIKEDKALILYGYAFLKDTDLKYRIKNYLNTSKYLTEEEKRSLK